ncbi:SLBB domain-containing protein [Planktomarina temperata]|nr:SLBB domain-containing protein [Planktomarina temperata]
MGQDYRLAAGDVLRVTLRGFEEVDQTVQIGRDGFLVLSNLPPIQVSGHTIGKVEERLLDMLRLDDASASAYLTLDTARLITVQVSGNVNAPRTLAVPAYTPLSRIFSYAGGIADNGSLRNVILSDRNGEMSRVDFYEFLQSPLGATDPVVVDNARVFVGDKGATVATTGFVARPGIYELPKGETQIAVTDLLKLSGTSFVPPGAVVEALYFDEDGTPDSRPVTLSEELFAGEALRVRFVETRDVSTLQVRGAVIGEYSLATTKALPVKDVLKNASVLWNFPLGKIFLGDAGAYTLGHVLAWIALLLMNRHPEISPLSLLLIFLWPITDMLLSMLRRKRSGKPIGQPDRLHFHQTVMRLLEIQFFTRSRRNLTNPLGTLIILPMAIAPMVLAVVFKTQTGVAFIAFWGFVALFAVAYRWALRRGGQAANRTSRKFEQS